MKNETNRICHYLSAIGKISFIVPVTVVAILLIGSYYVNCRERSWKQKWMEQAREIDIARQELVKYEMASLYEGVDHETVDFDELIRRIQSSTSEKVNNLVYEGSEGGFDFITHYTSTSTRRMKVYENPAVKISRFPRRQTAVSFLLLRLNQLSNILSPIEEKGREGLTPLVE